MQPVSFRDSTKAYMSFDERPCHVDNIEGDSDAALATIGQSDWLPACWTGMSSIQAVKLMLT
jgi:hypothetical protein